MTVTPRAARRFIQGLWLRLRFIHADLLGSDFAPPASLRFRASSLIPLNEFQRTGQGLAALVQARLASSGIRFSNAPNLLDFGCGCGRVLSWLAIDHPRAQLHGVDIDADAIAWCRSRMPSVNLLAIQPDPPLPYPPGFFDAVFALSVFDTLRTDARAAWIAEMHRVLKPGGTLLLTVNGSASGPVAAGGGSRYDAMLSEWFEEVVYEEITGGMFEVAQGRKSLHTSEDRSRRRQISQQAPGFLEHRA